MTSKEKYWLNLDLKNTLALPLGEARASSPTEKSTGIMSAQYLSANLPTGIICGSDTQDTEISKNSTLKANEAKFWN